MTDSFDSTPPTPAGMPKKVAGCNHPRGTHAPKHWVVAETLYEGREPTVLVDGKYPRRFANLNRVTIAPNAAIARQLGLLVKQCLTSRRFTADRTRLACGASINMVAAPIAGPFGQVRAVTLWAGAVGEELPPPPQVGVVEWDAEVVVSASAAARSLLLDDKPVGQTMLPEMLACFDRFDDRFDFLALLRLSDPVDQWIGGATRTFVDGTMHRLHLGARACGTGVARAVRAVVCDITDVEPPVAPDVYSRALRHAPIPAGHALALIDLSGFVIHDWVANHGDPIGMWAHHRPLLHPDDRQQIRATGFEMLVGTRTTASVRVRIRFDAADEWIELESHWTRIVTGAQPQVLADIALVGSMPPSIVDMCTRCRLLSEGAA
ncbi:GAF domain-containing protein [Nocardia sp. NBC_01327]|uniref:GAF domain-containing protein n=1 Tax=Nocardia sp. NBC_01327 TaxID=2903593 RepID=UPI002E0D73BB|nr:DUF5593 domain-containing protein [Nocardia sp. NBC_01327]